jgi:hypothetical protein
MILKFWFYRGINELILAEIKKKTFKLGLENIVFVVLIIFQVNFKFYFFLVRLVLNLNING